MRTIALIFAALLPSAVKVAVYRRVFGWRIGKGVKIGLSYIDAQDVTIGDGVRIGHCNRFMRLPVLAIGNNTRIWNGNAFVAHPEVKAIKGLNPSLVIGADAHIIGPHYFDIQAPLIIGDCVSLTGRGTLCFTHGLNCEADCLEASSVEIGHHCCIGAGVKIVPGSRISPETVIAMGAVVAGTVPGRCVAAGTPAHPIKSRIGRWAYFKR